MGPCRYPALQNDDRTCCHRTRCHVGNRVINGPIADIAEMMFVTLIELLSAFGKF